MFVHLLLCMRHLRAVALDTLSVFQLNLSILSSQKHPFLYSVVPALYKIVSNHDNAFENLLAVTDPFKKSTSHDKHEIHTFKSVSGSS